MGFLTDLSLNWMIVLFNLPVFTSNVDALYLPCNAPVNYCTEAVEKLKQGTDETCRSAIDVYVNRLDSAENLIPYGYERYDFCQAEESSSPSENLGQVVFGERIRPSPYKFSFKQNKGCQKVCSRTYKTDGSKEDKAKLYLLKEAVLLNYQHHWIIDNMPVTWCYGGICSPGFPVGCFVDGGGHRKDACVIDKRYGVRSSYYIFNHVNIDIEYHPVVKEGAAEDDSVARLVRARIFPYSIDQKLDKDGAIETCSISNEGEGDGRSIPAGTVDPNKIKEISITYSYNVTFTKSVSVFWASRWDYVLESMSHTRIQWFSITNSLVIVVFFTGVVTMILLHTLHKDNSRYYEANMEGAQKERGWKLVHGDIFRPPCKGMLLSVFLGAGSQIVAMTFIILLFACMGVLSPPNRGSLTTAALFTYVFLGFLSGYVASRMYKTFGGERWKSNVLLTSFLIPGIIFADYFLLNLLLWGEGSSAAVPFSTLIVLLGLWFCIFTPLVFTGSYFGFKQRPINFPVDTSQIPKKKFLPMPIFRILLGGIFPFGCIVNQLFYIMASIWYHQFYYMFGFLAVTVLIMVVICSEVTIFLCYFHLRSEDYHWWWRSFLTGGSTAFYFLIYCIHYFWFRLELYGLASKFLYFGYTFIMVLLLFLFCGTVGFFACFWFLMKIYSADKSGEQIKNCACHIGVQARWSNDAKLNYSNI